MSEAMSIRLRRETRADTATIRAVTSAAFREAPHTSHTEAQIVDALRAAGGLTLSLVAAADGVLIGHVALSAVSITDGAAGWYGLGPLLSAATTSAASCGRAVG
jgi:putative acetyltransferase